MELEDLNPRELVKVVGLVVEVYLHKTFPILLIIELVYTVFSDKANKVTPDHLLYVPFLLELLLGVVVQIVKQHVVQAVCAAGHDIVFDT